LPERQKAADKTNSQNVSGKKNSEGRVSRIMEKKRPQDLTAKET